MRRDYTVEEIISMDKETVWLLPEGGLNVTFSDRTVKCFTNRIKINWYFWQLFAFNDVLSITSDSYIEDLNFTSDLPKDILSDIFWESFTRKVGGMIPGLGLDLVWSMSRRCYQIINELYNDSIFKMSDCVSTVDIEDLIDILDAPEVIEAKRKFRDGEHDASTAHDQVWDYVTSGKPELAENEISRGCRAEIFNRRQVNQQIGPRAFIPEINGEAFVTPIDEGYAEGFVPFYDRIIESKTASIAYFMAKAPLEESEYNNRMAQFLCGVIRGVTHNDCGAKKTVPWQVRKEDLKVLSGKFHMVKGKPVCINGDEKELVGKTIKMRSFTLCDSEDASMPCAICVGRNAWTVPPKTVLGHHLSTEPLARISQTILSTKHVISSTKPLFLDINEHNSQYILLNPENGHEVILKKQNKNYRYAIRFSREEAFFINDIHSCEDTEELVEAKISCVQELQLVIMDEKGHVKTTVELEVGIGGRGSPLTMDMLVYMRDKGWDIVGNNFEIDLIDWDFSKPVIRTPRRGSDIMQVLKNFQDFIYSRGKVRARNFETVGPAIQGLLDQLTPHIGVNMNHIEVFVRAIMSKVDAQGFPTYELPKADDPFMFCTMKDCIMNRSLGAALAFERQQSLVFSPGSYLREDLEIPGTELDSLWM